MPKITNTPDKAGELAEVNRAAIEHRAAWMGLIYDEMKKAGSDAEGILRKAIRRCGNIKGEDIRKKCGDTKDCGEFKKAFLTGLSVNTFHMDSIIWDRDNLRITFHYCALVAAWRKLGFDDDTCALLCDIAMEGDRGIAEAMGLSLELTGTIAGGCPACSLHFHT